MGYYRDRAKQGIAGTSQRRGGLGHQTPGGNTANCRYLVAPAIINSHHVCLVATCMSSLEKCLLRSSAHFVMIIWVWGTELLEIRTCFEN